MPLILAEEYADNLPQAPAEDLIRSFEDKLHRQDDLVYGIALFFEGICLVHAGQEKILETYRKQFRNIIQEGSQAIHHARGLLEEVKKDHSKAPLLEDYTFSPCKGHPDPPRLAKRGRLMVTTYSELFPDRPRSQAFTKEETFALIKHAAVKI